MTPQEKLKEIEEAEDGICKQCSSDMDWLIARVKELETALITWNDSCHPHPSEHPSMYEAKKQAESVLKGSKPL